jgi:hypothetical protein
MPQHPSTSQRAFELLLPDPPTISEGLSDSDAEKYWNQLAERLNDGDESGAQDHIALLEKSKKFVYKRLGAYQHERTLAASHDEAPPGSPLEALDQDIDAVKAKLDDIEWQIELGRYALVYKALRGAVPAWDTERANLWASIIGDEAVEAIRGLHLLLERVEDPAKGNVATAGRTQQESELNDYLAERIEAKLPEGPRGFVKLETVFEKIGQTAQASVGGPAIKYRFASLPRMPNGKPAYASGHRARETIAMMIPAVYFLRDQRPARL